MKLLDYIINEYKKDDDLEAEQEFSYDEAELDEVQEAPSERVYLKGFSGDDIEAYVRSQCEILDEAVSACERAKAQFDAVTDDFNESKLIDEAPEGIRKNISDIAARIDSMSVDRRMIKSTERKLSNAAYSRMERHDEELPRGLKFMEAQEEYYDTVRRDMRIIEGERMSLRLEAKDLVKKQLKIRNLAKLAFITFAMIFVIFIAMIAISEDDSNTAFFIIVSLVTAILAMGMVALLKITERQVLVTEVKLNKATALLNKIKIKFVNAANTLDYEYEKYGVKSAYELKQKYKAYFEMKEERNKILEMTSAMSQEELNLEDALRKVGVRNISVWLRRVKALYIPGEMVEIRHEMLEQRQKLRNRIAYNEERIEEAKNNVKNMTLSNPKHKERAFRIIEMYDNEHRVAK